MVELKLNVQNRSSRAISVLGLYVRTEAVENSSDTVTVIYIQRLYFTLVSSLVETTTVGYRVFLEYNTSKPRQQTDWEFT